MAVIDAIPGIKVAVKVGGRDAIEYDDPHASESTLRTDTGCHIVSKYIESVDDMAFSIELTIDDDVYAWDDTKHVLSMCAEIDGRYADAMFAKKGFSHISLDGPQLYSQESRQSVLKRFHFSAIKKVDNCNLNRVKKDAEHAQKLGLIEVSLEREVIKRKCRRKPTQSIEWNACNVAEKALKGKAISHSITLGEDEAISTPRRYSTFRVTTDKGPIAIFRFLYRSRECLKQELVIPRTPSPEPAGPTASKSLGDMSILELQRLAQERLDQIKAQDTKDVDKSGIKREADKVIDLEDRPAKRPAVFIDLTDD